MIRLSVENNDAIKRNLYIHSYEPVSDKMVFGQSLGLDIVQHSLSFDNTREAELVISEIIRYISKEINLPPLVSRSKCARRTRSTSAS